MTFCLKIDPTYDANNSSLDTSSLKKLLILNFIVSSNK